MGDHHGPFARSQNTFAHVEIAQLRTLVAELTQERDDARRGLPSVQEALAFAQGHAEGLKDAEDQDAAKLIMERDAAHARLAFERALRLITQRDLETVKANYAQLSAVLAAGKAVTRVGAAS